MYHSSLERRARRRAVAARAGSAAALQVLLVDSDLDQRELLKCMLDCSGYLVRTARTSAEALQVAREHLPDVVITELLDGRDELHLLDSFHHGILRDIPVIVMSAWVDQATQTRVRLHYASAFLAKPAPVDAVITVVEQLTRLTLPSARDMRQLRRRLLALQRIAARMIATHDMRDRFVALANRLQEAVLLFDDSGALVLANRIASELFAALARTIPAHDTLVTREHDPITQASAWCGTILLPVDGDRRRLHGACLRTGPQGFHLAGMF